MKRISDSWLAPTLLSFFDNMDERRNRERGGGDDGGRNVRQRVNEPEGENGGGQNGEAAEQQPQQQQQRSEPFLARVPMAVQNMTVIRGDLSAGPTEFPATFELISLQELVASGPRPGTLLPAVILSVGAKESTQTQQRGFNGRQGAQSTARHTRRFILMCLLSEPGSNVLMIFQGNGLCPRLFADVECRDNGTMSEFATLRLVC